MARTGRPTASQVILVIASIALGTLVGASLTRWLTEKLGWWRLQLTLSASASATERGGL